MNYVSPSSSIGKGTRVNDYVRIYGKTKIGCRCFIGDYTIIGHPCEEDVEEAPDNKRIGTSKELARSGTTTIGDNVIIQPNVIIYYGASIGDRVRIGPFVNIGYNSTIGAKTRIMYHSQIYENVHIGKECKIGGFLCDCSKIGNSVTIFGSLVHDYKYGWNDPRDLKGITPIIEDNVFLGFGSIVIGKVRVRSGTIIAAGAIVKKDIPENSFVKGVNEIIPKAEYKGSLKDSKLFKGGVQNEIN